MQPGSPGVQAFFSWVNPYGNGGLYELVGVADIRLNKTEYRWGADEAKAYEETYRNKPHPEKATSREHSGSLQKKSD
jgi:hypothetical protein